MTETHQLFSGIGNSGRTGVCDQGNILPFPQPDGQPAGFFNLTVFVVAGHWRPDIKVAEEADGVSGIFRGDQICFF